MTIVINITSKRSFQSQIEHWMRQNDIWKDGIIESLDELKKASQRGESVSSPSSRDWGDGGAGRRKRAQDVTRHDLDLLRSSIDVIVQERVAASMSNFYDKIEQSIHAVEEKVSGVSPQSSSNADKGNTSEDSNAELRLAEKVILESILLLL